MSAKLDFVARSEHKLVGKMGFRIGRTIGKGTYSKVCLSTNSKGDKFACKIIRKKLAGSDFIEKFLPREIEIITAIKHPNIIQVYKIMETQQVIYMFMDYCRDGDLLEYIREYGCFPEEKAKHYFRPLVEAVAYLHDLDIAHRDIKCENIFLMANKQVKLGDFGFARMCTDAYGKHVLSDTFCGSAAYAAPEILKGISYDPKMYDMWSLGCVLYIMVSASMPFDDLDVKRMIKSQLNRSIFTVTLLWPDYSLQMKNLLNSLLEPDLHKRITIGAVKQHEWFDRGHLLKLKRFLSRSTTSLL
ncbi:testis-specific serine/threonine-protein kinase 3 [Dendroctonus ponderosae]